MVHETLMIVFRLSCQTLIHKTLFQCNVNIVSSLYTKSTSSVKKCNADIFLGYDSTVQLIVPSNTLSILIYTENELIIATFIMLCICQI